jgi:hypothetical protein
MNNTHTHTHIASSIAFALKLMMMMMVVMVVIAMNSVEKSYSIGRDMGAAPPRQTEFRVKLPGYDFDSQLRVALDAFDMFGFPRVPDDALALLQRQPRDGLCLSIITSSEGFVRLGLLCPQPSADTVSRLCSTVGASYDAVANFQNAIRSTGPVFVEFQYLREGFGYGVYQEGFDIVFHFSLGEEISA